jgi:antitoxin (DNA-binding transcriptional repressor) of toxin-antitoxin stability system
MKVVNIHEAKTTLSQLLESVLAGEDVVISKAGTPLLESFPITTPKNLAPLASGKVESR